MLENDYKFYLSFENSNCTDYITEKLFENALGRNILPIFMGTTRTEYEKYAPERSFIHVADFQSPKELANYLNELDKNDTLYNSYFKWKGTGEIIEDGTNMFCRMCAILHDDQIMSVPRWYENINQWWNGPTTCTRYF